MAALKELFDVLEGMRSADLQPPEQHESTVEKMRLVGINYEGPDLPRAKTTGGLMAHIRDRGKSVDRRWMARYRCYGCDNHPDGGEHTQSFKRKNGRMPSAQAWLDQEVAKLTRGDWVDPNAGRITLEEYARAWLQTQTFDPATREATERRFRNHIFPTLAKVELRNLRPSSIRSWLAGQDGAASSIRVRLVNLSQVLSAAVDDGLMPSNPCQSASVKAPAIERRRIVPWTVEQVEKVLVAHPIAYRAVPVIGAACGLRQGEIFGLRVDDVDFLGRRLLVRRQAKMIEGGLKLAPPKGKRERAVPLPDVVAVALSERIRKHPPVDGVILTRQRGSLIRGTDYNVRFWKPALLEAGIEPSRETGMHQLRHHYASVLLDGGVSIRDLADFLGHQDPGFTLRIYAHMMPNAPDRARTVVDAAHAPAESSRNEGTADG